MNFKQALERIKTVADSLPDDDPDKLEMLNVEGDYQTLIEWAIVRRNEYLSKAEANKELSVRYKTRQDRFEKKADDMKDIIGLIMNCAGETKYNGIATVSIKSVPPKPIITDESIVPDEYKVTKVSIDKKAINDAVKNGIVIDGVSMDNGGTTIMIRSS